MRRFVLIGVLPVVLVIALAGGAWVRWVIQIPYIEAEKLVKAELRDPDSAQFRNWRRATGRAGGKGAVEVVEVVCGDVNAKNAMGGYTGFQPFIVQNLVSGRDPLVWMAPTVDDLPSLLVKACQEAPGR